MIETWPGYLTNDEKLFACVVPLIAFLWLSLQHAECLINISTPALQSTLGV